MKKTFKLNLQLFAEETPADEETPAEEQINIAEELGKIKEGFVPKAQLEAAQKQIKDLMSAAVNGFSSKSKEEEEEKPSKRSIDDIRKDLFGRENNNLEYTKLALELRTRLMEEGNPDPFIPVGRQISPTNEDIEAANRVAEVFQECIDYAEGDSAVFTNELQRRTIETQILKKGAKA